MSKSCLTLMIWDFKLVWPDFIDIIEKLALLWVIPHMSVFFSGIGLSIFSFASFKIPIFLPLSTVKMALKLFFFFEKCLTSSTISAFSCPSRNKNSDKNLIKIKIKLLSITSIYLMSCFTLANTTTKCPCHKLRSIRHSSPVTKVITIKQNDIRS